MLKPIEIQAKTFKTGRGYKKEEVDEFILQVGKDYEQLYRETTELKDKINSLNEGLQYYKSMEGTLQKALVLAEKTSSETTENAEKKAEEIEAEAKQRAAQMIEDAKMEVGRIVLQKNALQEEYQNFRMRFKKLALTQLEAMEGAEYRKNLEQELENGGLENFMKREFPELKQPEPISLFLDEAKKQSAAKLDEAVEKTVDELLKTELPATGESKLLTPPETSQVIEKAPAQENTVIMETAKAAEEGAVLKNDTTKAAPDTILADPAKELLTETKVDPEKDIRLEAAEKELLTETKADPEKDIRLEAAEKELPTETETKADPEKDIRLEAAEKEILTEMKADPEKDTRLEAPAKEAHTETEADAVPPEKETLQDIFARMKAKPESGEEKKETQIPWNDIIQSSKKESEPEMIDISKRIDVSQSGQSSYRILDSYQKGSMKVVYAVKERPGQVFPEGDTHKVITEEEKRRLEDTVRFEIIE